MAYCTQQQLTDKFGETELIQLTDFENLGVINVTRLLAAQEACDSDINKRLRMKGWVVPLVTVTADIVAIALDITRFYLIGMQTIQPITDAYKRRIKELDDYVAGRIMLDIGLPNESTTNTGDIDFYTAGRVFNADTLRGF